MEKYSILLGYFDKQISLIKKDYTKAVKLDLKNYHERSSFALRTQAFYTAIEDLFKQIAKAFENHIENLNQFHKEILLRMNTQIPKIRPAVISSPSLLFLDKIRAFRHFIRHAYDCELDEDELRIVQERLKTEFSHVEKDLQQFRSYIQSLA